MTIAGRWHRRTKIIGGVGSALVVLSLVVVGTVAAANAAPRGLRLTETHGASAEWWRPEDAPARWIAPGLLAERAQWRRTSDGVEWSELAVSGGGEASALKLVALRIDPRRVRFALQWGVERESGRPGWTVDTAPSEAVVAVNAGMFVDALPWGWVKSRGGELLAPGLGPLSTAFAVLRDGTLEMAAGHDVQRLRERSDVIEAFQSYPTLLEGDGHVPLALREGDAIDRTHRDARLALGLDRDGRAVLVLTRLDVGIAALAQLPVGLTVPQMAAVMGSFGAARAVLLDGGISAQLQLREENGARHVWRGVRAVPLALVVFAR